MYAISLWNLLCGLMGKLDLDQCMHNLVSLVANCLHNSITWSEGQPYQLVA